MEKFVVHEGLLVPLDRENVDTDQIIPKQFLKSIKRTGFGPNLFDEWRYLDQGEPGVDNSRRPLNPEFVLNQPRYQGASILLARANFGCGSSREHAPWALQQYGFKAILAPSFADIFFNNCFKNGLLPIVLPEENIERLFQLVTTNIGFSVQIDLPQQRISAFDSGKVAVVEEFGFAIEPFRKDCLINGWDDIALTLKHADTIKSFETQRLKSFAWLDAADQGATHA